MRLRRQGTKVNTYKCQRTGVYFWEAQEFKDTCPQGLSCWACPEMLKKRCSAEELMRKL